MLRRLVDGFYLHVINVEINMSRGPLHRINMKLGGVYWELLYKKLVAYGWVAPRMHPISDDGGVSASLIAQQFKHTYFGRSLRYIFVTNRPQGDMIRACCQALDPCFKIAELRGIFASVRLGFADDELVTESALA